MSYSDLIYYGCVLCWTSLLAGGLLYADEQFWALAVLVVGLSCAAVDLAVVRVGLYLRRGSR